MQASKEMLKDICNIIYVFYIKYMRFRHKDFIPNCIICENNNYCNCLRINDVNTILNCMKIPFNKDELEELFHSNCKRYKISVSESMISEYENISIITNYLCSNEFIDNKDDQNISCFLSGCIYYLAEYYHENDNTRKYMLQMIGNILLNDIKNYDIIISSEEQNLCSRCVELYPLTEQKKYFKECMIKGNQNHGYIKCLNLLYEGIEITNNCFGNSFEIDELSPYLYEMKNKDGDHTCA